MGNGKRWRRLNFSFVLTVWKVSMRLEHCLKRTNVRLEIYPMWEEGILYSNKKMNAVEWFKKREVLKLNNLSLCICCLQDNVPNALYVLPHYRILLTKRYIVLLFFEDKHAKSHHSVMQTLEKTGYLYFPPTWIVSPSRYSVR